MGFLAPAPQSPYQLDCCYYRGLEPVLPRLLPEFVTAFPGTSSCGLRRSLGPLQSTRISGRFSARPEPLRFLHINPMTTGSTFSRALHHPRDGCIHCQVQRPRLWRRTWRTPWLQGVSILLPPPPMHCSSLWRRRTKPCDRVSTTGIRNRYPLPIIASAFEPLQGATIFSKLDGMPTTWYG